MKLTIAILSCFSTLSSYCCRWSFLQRHADFAPAPEPRSRPREFVPDLAHHRLAEVVAVLDRVAERDRLVLAKPLLGDRAEADLGLVQEVRELQLDGVPLPVNT